MTVVTPREEKDLLGEILENTRNMSKRIRALESKDGSGHYFSVLNKSKYPDHIFHEDLRWDKSSTYDTTTVDWKKLSNILAKSRKTHDEVLDLLKSLPGISDEK